MKPEDARTHGFKSLGEFLSIVRRCRVAGVDDARLKTLTEGTDSAGGFLIPPEYSDMILYAAVEDGIGRANATIVKMSRDVMHIPVLIDSDRSASLFGGVKFAWIAEEQNKLTYAPDIRYPTEYIHSNPAVGQITLIAKKGLAIAKVSNELMADVDKFSDFFTTAFGKAVAFYEDYDFFHGSGVGRPLGFMHGGSLIEVTRNAIGYVNVIDFAAMAARLLPGSWKNAVWMMNQTVLAELLTLNAAAANVASVIDFGRMTIFNRPIIITEKCAALGTTGDVVLADWKNGYVIGDRELFVDYTAHDPDHFLTDQTLWKVIVRSDGQPTMAQPLTPLNGGATLSQFVVLSTSS